MRTGVSECVVEEKNVLCVVSLQARRENLLELLRFELFISHFDDVENLVGDVPLGHGSARLRHLVRMNNHERAVVTLLHASRLHERSHVWILVTVTLPKDVSEVGEHGTNIVLILLLPRVNVCSYEVFEHLSLRLLCPSGVFSGALLGERRLYALTIAFVTRLAQRRSLWRFVGINLLVIFGCVHERVRL